MKAYKYKLKPSAKVIAIFEIWLGLLCELYNAALQERRDAYRINGVSVCKKEQSAQLPEIKKERDDLARIHSQVLQETLNRVDLAFNNFFRRIKEGQIPGFPRFRSHHRYDSFTYPQSGFKLDQKAKKLHLSKIGSVKVHLSRLIEGTIKTCTIKREADGWHVIFVVEEVERRPVVLAPNETVGVDVGIKSFASLSTGEEVENPRFLRKGEAELKKAQRRVSRRIKKSARRKKAVKLLGKKHQHVARQRRDFHFKEAKKLVVRFRVIKFEDLQVKNMVRNHHLAKSICDAGWSQFILITVHKAEEAGGQVEEVNAAGTSQRCSRCGQYRKMPLQVRTYRCGNCGLVIDRDHNSGINIKERKGRIVLSSRRRVAVAEEARTYRATDPESPTITRPRV
jgi:putative transposase